MFRRTIAAAGLAVLLTGSAYAATETFHATLTGGAEVPPTTSTGKGMATVTLDTATHMITYDVTFSGFTSAVMAAHIHGPAPAGKNAGVVVPLGNAPKSPIHGTATLTAEQQKDLEDGMMYINVHTANNKSGAVRGQLMK